MAEPGPPLEVRIDDEADERNRPEPATDVRELEARHEIERERERTEDDHLRSRQRTRGELTYRRSRVPRVDLGVDQSVQAHRERAGADHRDSDPDERVRAQYVLDGQERADVRKRQREDRVLDLDQ